MFALCLVSLALWRQNKAAIVGNFIESAIVEASGSTAAPTAESVAVTSRTKIRTNGHGSIVIGIAGGSGSGKVKMIIFEVYTYS